MIGYFIILIVFVLGFMPLMMGFLNVASTTATAYGDNTTPILLGLLIPLMLVIFIVAFFLRMKGDIPPGQW